MVTFQTTVTGVGNNAGIEVPAEVIDQLGAGKRPPVLINVNGYEYRSTVAVMGGAYMLSVSAAVRKESGLSVGDAVTVTLTVADAPREVLVPDDFAAAMNDAGVRTFFDGLANSLQRFHVDNINGTTSEETRARRIDKAVELFREGKKR